MDNDWPEATWPYTQPDHCWSSIDCLVFSFLLPHSDQLQLLRLVFFHFWIHEQEPVGLYTTERCVSFDRCRRFVLLYVVSEALCSASPGFPESKTRSWETLKHSTTFFLWRLSHNLICHLLIWLTYSMGTFIVCLQTTVSFLSLASKIDALPYLCHGALCFLSLFSSLWLFFFFFTAVESQVKPRKKKHDPRVMSAVLAMWK